MAKLIWIDNPMTWTPPKEWAGQDCFLIGGGTSLVGFNFTSLIGKNTIGCNEAFRLGPDVVKMLVFGDAGWWHRLKWDLETLPQRVVTNAPSLLNFEIPNLLRMHRAKDGIAEGDTLAWNHSTGAMAVNLAVSMGATQIYLLGYDLSQDGKGQSHWHNHYGRMTQDYAFQRFIKGFEKIAAVLSEKYPEVKVFNVTDGRSKLNCFTRISFEDLQKVLTPRQEVAA